MDHIILSRPQASALHTALLPGDDDEHLVVAFAGRHLSAGGLRLLVRDIVGAIPADYLVQTAFHLEMQPAFWARVAKRARATGESIVIFHSHPCSATRPDFSPSDDWGEEQLLPKLFARADGPHATVVYGPGGARARLHTQTATRPMIVATMWDVAPTAEDSVQSAFGRQILALGPAGHNRLRAARVGVVGLGGTGSHVVQQLLHLGVGSIVAVDPDRVEMSNLSRLVGARMVDAERSIPKTEVVKRLAADLAAGTRLVVIKGDVCDDTVARQLADDVDLIVGCTDTQWSRLVLNALAFTHSIPLVDLGVELQATGSMGGRVAIAGPGDGCLWCQGLIDESRLRAEQSSPELRAAQRAFGYIPDIDVPAPAVVSINGVVASLAVTEILDRIVRLRGSDATPASMLVYRLTDGTVRRVAPLFGSCAFCTGPAVGTGDVAALPTRPTSAIRAKDYND